MPWMIDASVAGGDAVFKQYEPDITKEQFGRISKQRFYLDSRLGSHRPLTVEETEAIPVDLSLLVSRSSKRDVPSILGWNSGPFIVNERVRELIDCLEPSVQKFLPIKVRAKDRKPIQSHAELAYFLILQPPVLDCVDIARTTWGDRGTGREAYQKYKRLSAGDDAIITLKGSVIAGHHLWRAMDPLHNNFFCSDKLREMLKAENHRGWAFLKQCEVSGN